MFPSFHNESYVLTNIIGLKIKEPQRGDVVVFKAPPDPEKAFIKRVIAIPGDTIGLKNGKILVNGSLLDESAYIKDSVITNPGTFLQEGKEVQVPNNNYIVMGDNRAFSSDSREWGFVPIEKITGYSWFVYWPVSEAKFVKNPLTP